MKGKLNRDFGSSREQVMRAIESIREHVQPEMVICFGWIATGRMNIFCNVLVLTEDREKRPLEKLQRSLKRGFDNPDIVDGIRGYTRINWLLQPMTSVKRLIQWRHPFYSSIARNGIVLFKSKGARLPLPGKTSPSAAKYAGWDLRVAYGDKLKRLAELAAGGLLHKLCAYYLYLALEQYGIAILGKYMAYKGNVPNAGKLFDLLDLISPEFHNAFYHSYGAPPFGVRDLVEAYEEIGIARNVRYDSKKLVEEMTTFRNIVEGLKDSKVTACSDVS